MVVSDLHRSNGIPESVVDQRTRLLTALEHAVHLLPAQGPITVFIHHNTLHAFEHLPFHQAVIEGGITFGCEPYLTETRYREALSKGRIRFADLQTVLAEDLGSAAAEPIASLNTRLELRLTQLQYALTNGPEDELRWFMAENESLSKFRPDAASRRGPLIAETRRWVMRDLRGRNGTNPAWVQKLFKQYPVAEIEAWTDEQWESFTLESLWELCRIGVNQSPIRRSLLQERVRHRDYLLAVCGIDIDLWVHDLLIRFTAAYLDQGLSQWPLIDRDQPYLQAFCGLYARPGGPPDRWLRGLSAEVSKVLAAKTKPLDSILVSLRILGVPQPEWESYLSATLLALRGWGGIVQQVEIRPDRVARPVLQETLVGYVAVRLILERLALAYASQEALNYRGSLAELRGTLKSQLPPTRRPSLDERAFPVFQMAQLLGWTPADLNRLSVGDWSELAREVHGFTEIGRRRVFHIAYERRFREQCLDAFALHAPQEPKAIRFQLITCLDEREESFRRHTEEVAPDCETFGAAGFFAVPMYYRGVTDAHFVPLCPIVMTPQHWVEELPDDSVEDVHRRVKSARRLLAATAHRAHLGTRTFALGALITAAVGLFASIPLVLRTLFPRLAARLRGSIGRFVTPPRTRLKLERSPECGPAPKAGHIGFTVEEMATQAERLLRDIGLTKRFARLVFVFGHGSNSLNNPHKSAYDCGACGGSPGVPNGRAIAAILNDTRVRDRLTARGIAIPADTRFVGGYHNTCDDSVALFDLDRIPDTHRVEVESAWNDFELVCDRNAHERCRRFMSAPLTISPSEARRHVEGRSEDLAQTRPELGHATNAICHVGRRSRTRGLYLDRRAFLTAYDPTIDDEDGTILARTMAAVFPVCGGINLEYYFSHVDSAGYGCSTKLPHNITSLLGVMDGAASDMRTGLPWQMVEIHEPVRLLIVCETTPEIMWKVLNGNPLGRTMTENGWVQLAVQSPTDNRLMVFENGTFRPYVPTTTHLPSAAVSADWYRGWREHLEFAEIFPVKEANHA